jgi:hypothetical protein
LAEPQTPTTTRCPFCEQPNKITAPEEVALIWPPPLALIDSAFDALADRFGVVNR